uniref:HTH CENPB-type domain-containing protein n=1 Tax=Rhodnius prolixus TaxID=13249 RepID=T1HBY5_RHOPR
MSAYNNEAKQVPRPGLKKQIRHIDRKIWLWSSENNVSKRDIKEFAKKAFEEAGYANFKASNGWYRRWFGRWRNQAGTKCIKTDKLTTERINTKNRNESLKANCFTLHSSSKEEQNVEKPANIKSVVNDQSSTLTQRDLHGNTINYLPSLINSHETNIEDCEATNGLSKSNNFKNTTNRKKGERYLPHFKHEVVTFALKYSIKEAAFCYKVNKGTISDWIREDNKFATLNIRKLKTEPTPDVQFINWLKNEREEGRVLKKDQLRKKIKELLEKYQNVDVKKSSKWFYNYHKKLEDDSLLKLPPVIYPLAFKIELALLCRKFSQRVLSDTFNIDRKRIRDWFHLHNSDDLKDVKRNASNYLTDPNIDKQIWDWYQTQTTKPTGKQIRDKGTELYNAAGFNEMRCSPGWFYRWCKRYSLPQAHYLRSKKDTLLLVWLLGELDRNNNITYENLKAKACQLWDTKIKSPLENVQLQDQSLLVLAQSNAVNDESTIYSWFTTVFSNAPIHSITLIRVHILFNFFRDINHPVIIICDDFKPHKFLKDFHKQELQEKQIEIMLLPEGCNSKLQPICFSLSQQFMTEIDIQWSTWNRENCWSSVNGASRSPNELDIYNWVVSAHSKLSKTYKDKIQDSFIKAGFILPTDSLDNQVKIFC